MITYDVEIYKGGRKIMCQWCVKHGDGGKWYLNTKNYAQKMYKVQESIAGEDALPCREYCLAFLEELYQQLGLAVRVTQPETIVKAQNNGCCFKCEWAG